MNKVSILTHAQTECDKDVEHIGNDTSENEADGLQQRAEGHACTAAVARADKRGDGTCVDLEYI